MLVTLVDVDRVQVVTTIVAVQVQPALVLDEARAHGSEGEGRNTPAW